MRKPIVAANWKMNLRLEEAIELWSGISKGYESMDSNAEVVVCPPACYLSTLIDKNSSSRIQLGAQNCHQKIKGAFTGEISAVMLKSLGVDYVVLGHSERRMHFKETDELIGSKVKTALDAGLKVIFCCGEPLEERENDRHFSWVRSQLERGLSGLPSQELANLVVAYEPIWAIGTGHTASPEQAQQMHHFIREFIKTIFGANVAGALSILYGGSCKPSNASEIFSGPDVDGGLIGGASLEAASFLAIIEALSDSK